jgi:hypothetical protein
MAVMPTVAPPAAPAAKASPAPSPPKLGPPSGPVASQLARSAPPSGLAGKQAIGLGADVPAAVVELVGGAEFAPAPAVADYLAAKKGKPAQVRVQLGNVASGTIKVQRHGDRYETPSAQPVPLLIPWLAPLRDIGIDPVLAVKIRGGQVEGYASVVTKGVHVGDSDAFLETLEKSAAALGWLGLEKPNLRGAQNKLVGPTLTVTAPQVSFGLAKFLTATGSFSLENSAFTFETTATGKIAQLGTVTVPIKGNPDGSISGSAQIDIAVKGFTGQANVVFARGLVDVRGEVGYSNDKFDGKVTIIATDAASAKQIIAGQIPGQPPTPNPQAAASTPAAATPVVEGSASAEGPKPGPRVVAGWGKVNVKLADWLTGDALVVVSPEWYVTVVGTITPRMNKPLFPQKDFAMVLFAPPELRASYGLPVIGNVFLFANIVLTAEARLGPATLKDMSMTGTWSTDPKVLQSFGLTGTLNISGFAGLRLKASGGAGIEILSHDIKAGISVWALAGIKGYVEATPRIGYRELADPQAGKKGEFFIGGHMELAARPFLELGGELFVELDSPWWSPAPDKRWPWDLGSIEYPLPGEFGIGADVEHILGSEKVPEVKFGAVDFNSEKFLTDLVSDAVPPKTSVASEKKGAWKEPAAPVPAPTPVPTPPPTVKGQPAGAALPGAKPKPAKTKPRTPAQQQKWNAGVAAIAELAKRSETDPFTEVEVDGALKSIRRKFGFSELKPVADGAFWIIDAAMSPGETAGKVKRDPKKSDTASQDADANATVDAHYVAEHFGRIHKKLIEHRKPGGRINLDVLTRTERLVLEDVFEDTPLSQVTLAMVAQQYGQRGQLGKVEKEAKRATDKEQRDKAAAEDRERRANQSVYDTIANSDVPTVVQSRVEARSPFPHRDEYTLKPFDNQKTFPSFDHTVAKREFADYPGVKDLEVPDRKRIVHDVANVRHQDKRMNSLRQHIPWDQDFGGKAEYSPDSLGRALMFYGRAQTRLHDLVKTELHRSK